MTSLSPARAIGVPHVSLFQNLTEPTDCVLTRNTYLVITLAQLGLVAALKLSPVGRGQELDAYIVVRVHTLFFLLFFFFACCVVLFFFSYSKGDFWEKGQGFDGN